MTKKISHFHHEFVDLIPETLEDGIVYVSIPYTTAVHRCACGCGNEVVTPLSPTDWKVIFDGKTVSLDPSIGNWSFDCQSHYFIRKNRVDWYDQWSKARIDAGRERDAQRKEGYFSSQEPNDRPASKEIPLPPPRDIPADGILDRIRRFWPF